MPSLTSRYLIGELLVWLRRNPNSRLEYVGSREVCAWANNYFATQHPDLLTRIEFRTEER
jgi:hypothetical protein